MENFAQYSFRHTREWLNSVFIIKTFQGLGMPPRRLVHGLRSAKLSAADSRRLRSFPLTKVVKYQKLELDREGYDSAVIKGLGDCSLKMILHGSEDADLLSKEVSILFDNKRYSTDQRVHCLRKACAILSDFSAEGRLVALPLQQMLFQKFKDLDAAYQLCRVYGVGIPPFIPANKPAAMSILQGMATNSDPKAHYYLGKLYMQADKAKAAKHLTYACKHNFAPALALFGEMQARDGNRQAGFLMMDKARLMGVSVNALLAAEVAETDEQVALYTRLAAEQGDPYGHYKLAKLLLKEGKSTITEHVSLKEAIAQLEAAYGKRSNLAAYELGRIFFEGLADSNGDWVVQKNNRKSLQYLEKLSFSMTQGYKELDGKQELYHLKKSEWQNFATAADKLTSNVRNLVQKEYGMPCLII